MSYLRDLNEDRAAIEKLRGLEWADWSLATKREVVEIADAALDEIDRLKRFLVWRNPITGKWSARIDCHTSSGAYETEADAWAAVRKAAANGK